MNGVRETAGRYSFPLAQLFACVLLHGCATLPSIDALQWQAGTPRKQIEAELHDAGALTRAPAPDRLVVFATLLPSIYASQRGLLVFSANGTLEQMHVLVEPLPQSSVTDVMRLYEEVRALCVRRAGSPDREYAEGDDADPNLLHDLTTGRYTRMVQWNDGGTLRMGIPQRTDGQIVIEIELSGRRLPLKDGFRGASPF